MVRAALVLLLLSAGQARASERVALAEWAAALPDHFTVHGVKTEPTYEEAVDITRKGNLFSATGGAPGWAERLTESVAISAEGEIARRPCPGGQDCRESRPPSGFLATAALVAAARRGKLSGFGEVAPFGPWRVICVDASKLGIAAPILDPCFEVRSGAAIAERHRLTGRFDGPTMTPDSISIE